MTRRESRRALVLLLALLLAGACALVAIFVVGLLQSSAREAASSYDAVYVVGRDGKGLRRLTNDRRRHSFAWSPDGNWIVAQSTSAGVHESLPGPVELIRPDRGTVREIRAGGFAFDPVWRSPRSLELLGTSNVTEVKDTRMLALPLGASTIEPGRSVGRIGAAAWSMSGERLAVARCGPHASADELEVFAAGGRPVARLGRPRGSIGAGVCADPEAEADESLAWAPDGRSLYVRTSSGLWRYSPVGGASRRIERASQTGPVGAVSPDGRLLVTERETIRAGETARLLYVLPAGGGRARLLAPMQADDPAWSPDGRTIAIVSGDAIFTVPSSGGSPTRVLSMSGDWIGDVSWSPDGRRLAFVAGVQAPET